MYMKNLLFGLLLPALLIVGCTQDNLEIPVQQLPEKLPAKISLTEALAHADRLFTKIEGGTRSLRSVKSVEYVGGGEATRGEEGKDPQYYLVNYENESGFAVLSANRHLGTVLAIGEEGNLSLEDTLDNPGLARFFRSLNDASSNLPTDSVDIPRPGGIPGISGPGNDTIVQGGGSDVVSTFLEPKMPKTVRMWPGEVLSEYPSWIVASLQVMATFAWPKYRYSGVYGKNIPWDWDGIQNFHPYQYYASSHGDIYYKINEFAYYLDRELVCTPEKCSFEKALRQYNYSVYENFKVSVVITGPDHYFLPSSPQTWKKELDEEKVLIAVSCPREENADIWAWVVDGYILDPSQTPPVLADEDLKIIFHCVWGKSGKGNGYFALLKGYFGGYDYDYNGIIDDTNYYPDSNTLGNMDLKKYQNVGYVAILPSNKEGSETIYW